MAWPVVSLESRDVLIIISSVIFIVGNRTGQNCLDIISHQFNSVSDRSVASVDSIMYVMTGRCT